MKLFSKAVIVAAVVALLLAPTAAFAQMKSAPGDPIGCPKGWVPVAPPVNPILRCLPGEIAAAVPTTPLATLDTRLLCPEGWQPVAPPLNPILRCQPDTIVLDTGRTPYETAAVFCPDGWQPVAPPWNPILRCRPDRIVARG